MIFLKALLLLSSAVMVNCISREKLSDCMAYYCSALVNQCGQNKDCTEDLNVIDCFNKYVPICENKCTKHLCPSDNNANQLKSIKQTCENVYKNSCRNSANVASCLEGKCEKQFNDYICCRSNE